MGMVNPDPAAVTAAPSLYLVKPANRVNEGVSEG